MAEEVRRKEWLVLDFQGISKNPFVRFHRMLAQLFYASSWESSGRWVRAPLVNPLLAPLLVVSGLLVPHHPAADQEQREHVAHVLLVGLLGQLVEELQHHVVGGPVHALALAVRDLRLPPADTRLGRTGPCLGASGGCVGRAARCDPVAKTGADP